MEWEGLQLVASLYGDKLLHIVVARADIYCCSYYITAWPLVHKCIKAAVIIESSSNGRQKHWSSWLSTLVHHVSLT